MSKENEQPTDNNARYTVPEPKKAAARKWFAQAKKLVDQRNYDYAIKSFIDDMSGAAGGSIHSAELMVSQGWIKP